MELLEAQALRLCFAAGGGGRGQPDERSRAVLHRERRPRQPVLHRPAQWSDQSQQAAGPRDREHTFIYHKLKLKIPSLST